MALFTEVSGRGWKWQSRLWCFKTAMRMAQQSVCSRRLPSLVTCLMNTLSTASQMSSSACPHSYPMSLWTTSCTLYRCGLACVDPRHVSGPSPPCEHPHKHAGYLKQLQSHAVSYTLVCVYRSSVKAAALPSFCQENILSLLQAECTFSECLRYCGMLHPECHTCTLL